ncbi:unnamed protein product [Allacma fusca]|uniref:Uncharacterized protein n=1 Tax=Allacma fusca TaxID=39272 RepID=A0A8J2L7B4_9HEXA|nr:unnamed protein product [Allacma fusca]
MKGQIQIFVLLSLLSVGYCGNFRPYGVSVTGFQGSGTTGHDISANGYAGAAVVSPLASGGFNSPLGTYNPGAAFPGNAGGYGFGGYGVGDTRGSSGDQSVPAAGGQGKLPSAAYSG